MRTVSVSANASAAIACLLISVACRALSRPTVGRRQQHRSLPKVVGPIVSPSGRSARPFTLLGPAVVQQPTLRRF